MPELNNNDVSMAVDSVWLLWYSEFDRPQPPQIVLSAMSPYSLKQGPGSDRILLTSEPT